jgi:hypothetical protein
MEGYSTAALKGHLVRGQDVAPDAIVDTRAVQ